jgi:hypothetical protein
VDDHPEWLDDLIRALAAALRAARAAPDCICAVEAEPGGEPQRIVDPQCPIHGPPPTDAEVSRVLAHLAEQMGFGPTVKPFRSVAELVAYIEARCKLWAEEARAAAPPAGGEAGAREREDELQELTALVAAAIGYTSIWRVSSGWYAERPNGDGSRRVVPLVEALAEANASAFEGYVIYDPATTPKATGVGPPGRPEGGSDGK